MSLQNDKFAVLDVREDQAKIGSIHQSISLSVYGDVGAYPENVFGFWICGSLDLWGFHRIWVYFYVLLYFFNRNRFIWGGLNSENPLNTSMSVYIGMYSGMQLWLLSKISLKYMFLVLLPEKISTEDGNTFTLDKTI